MTCRKLENTFLCVLQLMHPCHTDAGCTHSHKPTPTGLPAVERHFRDLHQLNESTWRVGCSVTPVPSYVWTTRPIRPIFFPPPVPKSLHTLPFLLPAVASQQFLPPLHNTRSHSRLELLPANFTQNSGSSNTAAMNSAVSILFVVSLAVLSVQHTEARPMVIRGATTSAASAAAIATTSSSASSNSLQHRRMLARTQQVGEMCGDGTSGDNHQRRPFLWLCHAPSNDHYICIISGLRQRVLGSLQTHIPLSRRPPSCPTPSPYPQPAEATAALPADAYVVASPCPATASAAPGSRATAVFTVGASLNAEQFKEVALQVDFPKALWPTARLSCQTASSKGKSTLSPLLQLPVKHAHACAPTPPWRTLEQRGPPSLTQPHQAPTDLPALLLLCALQSTHPNAPAHSHHMRCARAQC